MKMEASSQPAVVPWTRDTIAHRVNAVGSCAATEEVFPKLTVSHVGGKEKLATASLFGNGTRREIDDLSANLISGLRHVENAI